MSLTTLPADLPIPLDDGEADHLTGMEMPGIRLPTTDGKQISLHSQGIVVYYLYPMTGRPDRQLPDGWEQIPGARGCTPQSCSFRDHHQELQRLGAGVYGVSVQSSEYQREAKERLQLPFELLSDYDQQLQATLGLPVFEAAGMQLYKRLTLIVQNKEIVKVFYPVFPPDNNANDVLRWLEQNI